MTTIRGENRGSSRIEGRFWRTSSLPGRTPAFPARGVQIHQSMNGRNEAGEKRRIASRKVKGWARTASISVDSWVAPATLLVRSLGCHDGNEALKSGRLVTPGQMSSSGVPRSLYSITTQSVSLCMKEERRGLTGRF